MNPYKFVVYFCCLLLFIIFIWDVYLGLREGEWFNLIALIMSVTIGYLLSCLVQTSSEKK